MTTSTASRARALARTCDVLVLGGGPGGAATATLLAEAGLDVVLIERERHPRFHIGESLLPHSLPLLDRLGVLARVRAIGVEKPGATFVAPDGEREVVFDFARGLTPGPDHAFQVRRQDFDALLFGRAREAGAQTLEETTARVTSLDEAGAELDARGRDGASRQFRARLLVDASGRSTVTARLQGEKRTDPRNTSAAIYAHFRGVPRSADRRAGNIRIHLTDPGWMWQIPLPGGVTSIGLVAPGERIAGRGADLEPVFAEHVARHPSIARALADAEPIGSLHGTGNFSYRATRAGGAAHLKVGDAYGFLDPIFSTGVHLALTSATEAADTVLRGLGRPQRSAEHIAEYDRRIRARLDHVAWFVYRINEPAFREMLLRPRNILGVEAALISLLAGDFRTDLGLRARIGLFKLFHRLTARTRSRRGWQHA